MFLVAIRLKYHKNREILSEHKGIAKTN